MTARRKTVATFALFGLVSGTISAVLLDRLPARPNLEVGDILVISPMSIVAGLVFGVIFGAILRTRGLANTRTAVLYAAASTASYFVAVNLALHLIDVVQQFWQIGMIAGLIGAACLTGLAAWLLPFVRATVPCVLMLGAGCLLGALLELIVGDGSDVFDAIVFFGAWQTGYAAAFAMAVPATTAKA